MLVTRWPTSPPKLDAFIAMPKATPACGNRVIPRYFLTFGSAWEMLAEMLNFEGDNTITLISLYCLSWMALDIGDNGLDYLQNIDITIVTEMIKADDIDVTKSALFFLSNYLSTAKDIVEDFIENRIIKGEK